jgi:hypothetical protein
MAHKCEGCLFKNLYKHIYPSALVCGRIDNLIDSIKAYEDPNPCKYHITTKEVIQLQHIFFDVIGPHLEQIKAIELYQEYKHEWCAARGYKLEDMDEEIGINGECYACFDEWYDNEYAEMKGE